MSTRLRMWMPVALCCVPGIAIAAIIGIGVAAGATTFRISLGGALGLAILALAVLACPATMGLMMLRQRDYARGTDQAMGTATTTVGCCLTGQAGAASEAGAAAERLVTLRTRREALERELAER